jgi:hypothetical protein
VTLVSAKGSQLHQGRPLAFDAMDDRLAVWLIFGPAIARPAIVAKHVLAAPVILGGFVLFALYFLAIAMGIGGTRN